MYSYPKIPLDILFLDSLKGKRKQIYLDCEGQHQYYKELNFTKQVQEFVKDHAKTAKRKNPDYCRVKFVALMHKICIKNFGHSLHITDWEVRE